MMQALALQLHHCLRRHGTTPQEFELLCGCIELLLQKAESRSNEPNRQERTRINGVSAEFVDQLSQVLTSPHGRVAQKPVLSSLHAISASSTEGMALIWETQILHNLVPIFSKRDISDSVIQVALGLLKNLSCAAHDRQLRDLLRTPGLLDALASLVPTASPESCNALSAVFRNLAVTPDSRSFLVRQPAVLTALIYLGTTALTDQSQGYILRNVLTTFASLAMNHDHTVLLIFHDDGILLNLLKRCITSRQDDTVRQRSARTLRWLSHHAAPLLLHQTELMSILSDTALHDSVSEVRSDAAEAFAACAANVKVEVQPHHEAVLDALCQLAEGSNVSRESLARTIKEQAAHEGNRKAMMERICLVERIAAMALAENATAAADCLTAFQQLAAEPANRERLARVPDVLRALVQHAQTRPGRARSEECEQAVGTLLQLALEPSNRMLLARTSSLLRSLIQFASAPDTNQELKRGVKKVILMLVSEL
jgi:hypothetical protein